MKSILSTTIKGVYYSMIRRQTCEFIWRKSAKCALFMIISTTIHVHETNNLRWL